ncbi:major facilitator superfamily domain-containing protein [Tricharina praecox]|uniref:major facilitator superfamily domain-containing protein n=1 Tax=Tricharina praecox TaxID=43433 RepID=UPI00221FE19B|nr:major facilitator superfamily domain-containing protein [Tricharina praecox]KAI5847563.1 major facilitator superfamily domain-containing protein [Tricharina praecox]
MASYGSLSVPATTRSTHSSSITSRDDEASSENTPLLLSSNRFQSPRHTDESPAGTIAHGDEHSELLSVLSITGAPPIGIEVEAIPPIACSPDENGDTTLPRDDTLRYRPGSVNGDGETSEMSFHGGISKGQFWVIFCGILLANFLGAFDGTIMASTHTSVTSDFKASELASWLSTSFLLTATSFQPLYGRLSDVLGRKPPFIFSCLVFTISTLWCARAQNIYSFIAARAVCGLGAGGMMTMGAIVLSDLLPIEIRGTYQSINNLAWGLGGVLGAATGGAIADAWGWRATFGLQVPFGVICVIVLFVTMPSRDKADSATALWDRFKDFDFAGSFYLTTGLMFLILGMNLGGNVLPWSDWKILASLCIGLVLANLLVRTEAKAISPVMPLKLLASSRGLIIFNNFFSMAIINAVLFNLPLYFQAVRLESATQAGSRLLIPAIMNSASGVVTGLIITRIQRFDLTFYIGGILMVVGCFLYTIIPRELPSWAYFFFLVPCHFGSGFVFPSALLGILAMSTQTDQAVVTSTLIMLRSLGGVMGVAMSSLIVQNFLLVFLNENVTGVDREEVIERARTSVQSIFHLKGEQLRQVTDSYNSALQLCFVFIFAMSLVAGLLIAKLDLPRLPGKKRANGRMDKVMCHVGE